MTGAVLTIQPGGKLGGRIRVPGDKSISHRALMLAAIADGVTRIEGFLPAEDTLATAAALRRMGVEIEHPASTHVTVHGVGRDGLRAPDGPLDMGNSGTAIRLLAGLLAGQSFAATLIGDASLSRRPMARVVDPLRLMGADIECSAQGTPPLHIAPAPGLQGIDYRLPVASAQVQSALLLAGLYAEGSTRISEPGVCRDHSERALRHFGYPVARRGRSVAVTGGGRLTGRDVKVPSDISSAAFFLVGASIAPGSDLTIEAVGVNPTRTGILDILSAMGAGLDVGEASTDSEPCAELRVRAAELNGIAIPPALVPLAIDEFPAVFVAAACAKGQTQITGAAELRVKESDRIAGMAEGLSRLGVEVEPTADGARITGGAIQGGRVRSFGDHRLAMALSMAGLRARETIVIEDCAAIGTSFPGFVDLARRAGLAISSDE